MTVQDDPQLALVASDVDKMILAGQLANEKAAGDVFADHMQHKADETKKAYKMAVNLFSEALAEIGTNRPTDFLLSDPEAWRGVGYGEGVSGLAFG